MPKRLEYQCTIDGRTWTLDYYSLMIGDWTAAERATGMHWAFLATQMDARSALGIKLAYWFARRQETPRLGFDDPSMNFRITDMDFEVIGDDEEGEQAPDPQESGASSKGSSPIG